MNIPAIPADEDCAKINPVLWTSFCEFFRQRFNCLPNLIWTEAEIVQFLDRPENPDYINYLDESADEAEYFQQFG